MYKHVPELQGITIDVKTQRKGKFGRAGSRHAGEGRNGKTGKVAVISQDGEDVCRISGTSFKDLSRKLRKKYNIPSSVNIAKRGATEI